MSDIVERLRNGEPCAACWGDADGTCKVKDARSGCGCAEAADEITRLRAEVEKLKDFETEFCQQNSDLGKALLENEKLKAALKVIGYCKLSHSAAADEENRRHARAAPGDTP